MGIILKIKWNHKIYSLYLKEKKGESKKLEKKEKRKIKTVDLNTNTGTKTETINDLNNLKGRTHIKNYTLSNKIKYEGIQTKNKKVGKELACKHYSEESLNSYIKIIIEI